MEINSIGLMDIDGQNRLKALNQGFEQVVGNPFKHFYCPLLYCDDDTQLCKGHIVNAAFPGIGRQWVVQRADVDGFYGSCFEADFVDFQYKDLIGATSIVDRRLAYKGKLGDGGGEGAEGGCFRAEHRVECIPGESGVLTAVNGRQGEGKQAPTMLRVGEKGRIESDRKPGGNRSPDCTEIRAAQ